eukprot:s4664_g4.t1
MVPCSSRERTCSNPQTRSSALGHRHGGGIVGTSCRLSAPQRKCSLLSPWKMSAKTIESLLHGSATGRADFRCTQDMFFIGSANRQHGACTLSANADREMSRPVFRPPPGLEDMSSIASIGHPELCSRPCVHIARGGWCPDGFDCRYCHIPHGGPGPKPDKAQRRLMKAMPAVQLRSIIFPHIVTRASCQGLLTHVRALLEVLEEVEFASADSITERELKSVNRALARMPLIALVRLFPHPTPERVECLIEAARWAVTSDSPSSRPGCSLYTTSEQ